MSNNILATHAYLDEVEHLAFLLIDQIDWIGMLNAPDESFARFATENITRDKSRGALKRLIEVTIPRIKKDMMGRLVIDRVDINAAARLVVWAIKRLIVEMDPANRWILVGRALIVQFSSIDVPWVEDLTRPQSLVE